MQIKTYQLSYNFVRVANGKLVKVLGIGDVGPLLDFLRIPRLTYDLISETQLENEGKCTFSYSRARIVYERPPTDSKSFGKLFLVAIQNEHNLFILKPIYLGLTDSTYSYQAFGTVATKSEEMEILHKKCYD